MPTSQRMLRTAPTIGVNVGMQRPVMSSGRPDPSARRVTRCVMPRFDCSKGWSGVSRERLPDEDPHLTAMGFRQTGRRCGPGGYGVEYEGPNTPAMMGDFASSARDMAALGVIAGVFLGVPALLAWMGRR